MTNKLTLPAEWYPADGILLAWPHPGTDWAYMLGQIRQCYIEMVKAVIPYVPVVIIGPDTDDIRSALSAEGIADDSRIHLLQVSTNDTWIRDYGILTTIDDAGHPIYNDFCFNGWGLKFAADRDNLANQALHAAGILGAGPFSSRLGTVLEGGSIDSDGQGTILTTEHCMLSPNRNGFRSRAAAARMLRNAFGAKRVLWLGQGSLEGDDTDGHIDTLARFASPCDILYTRCDDTEDSHFAPLSAMEKELRGLRQADGTPYNLIPLPLPDPVYDPDNGERLPATYANFLVIGTQAVIVPTYRQPDKDVLAAKTIQKAFPRHKIECVDATALIRQHGSIHCATMQMPRGALTLPPQAPAKA